MDDSQFGFQATKNFLGAVSAAILGYNKFGAGQFLDDFRVYLADFPLDGSGFIENIDDDADRDVHFANMGTGNRL